MMSSEGHIREKLKGYPEPVVNACIRFGQDRQQDDLDTFIAGVLFFLLNLDPLEQERKLSSETRLKEDLGIESITIAELLFLVEDLFNIEIDDADLSDVRTFGELKAFLRTTADSMPPIG